MNDYIRVFGALTILATIVSFSDGVFCQQRRRGGRNPPTTASTRELSRSRAAELIKMDSDFKSTFDRKIPVGRFWYDGQNIEYFLYDDLLPLVDQSILNLKKTGRKEYAGRYIEQIVELTTKGEIEAKAWLKTSESIKGEFEIAPDSPDVTVYRMAIAERQLVEVTGIAMNEGGKTARVEFTWKWIPTTQAKLLPKKVPSNEPHECAAVFRFYDDGWRLVKPFCIEEFP